MTEQNDKGMSLREHSRLNGLKYKWYSRLLTNAGFTTSKHTITQAVCMSRLGIGRAAKLEELTRNDPNSEGYVSVSSWGFPSCA